MTDVKKILVVDDDLYTREMYQETLLTAGYEVDIAGDGLSGLERAHQGGYALILLDAMMPKMDGLTMLSRLKEAPPKIPNGPIIVSTNLAAEAVCDQALQAGAKACIIKTDLNPDQLLAKVREFIQ